jgi:hypothetical protein
MTKNLYWIMSGLPRIQLYFIANLILGVWGVDEDNNVFNLDASGKWEKIAGVELTQVDSGPKGIVVGVTEDNDVYCLTGKRWNLVRGHLKYFSCGALGCWGVSPGNRVFYREGVSPKNCAGTSWVCNLIF